MAWLTRAGSGIPGTNHCEPLDADSQSQCPEESGKALFSEEVHHQQATSPATVTRPGTAGETSGTHRLRQGTKAEKLGLVFGTSVFYIHHWFCFLGALLPFKNIYGLATTDLQLTGSGFLGGGAAGAQLLPPPSASYSQACFPAACPKSGDAHRKINIIQSLKHRLILDHCQFLMDPG